MSSIVKVENLVKYYGTDGNIVKAVDHTDLEIERGKFTAIIGRSGSGKSPSVRCLTRISAAVRGITILLEVP